MDDLRIAAKQKDATAAAAGVIFNLGNMLILGGLSIAGVTVGYMIGLGLMLAFGMVIMQISSPTGNTPMLLASAVLILAAAVLLGFSARMNSLARLVTQMREGKTKSTKKVVSIKGLLLAGFGGIVASAFFPLVNSARSGENGLGPYSLGIFFAAGIAASTLIFGLFFMNLPVQGNPVEMTAYFKGKAKSHWLGILGGILFYFGLVSLLIVARAEGKSIVPLIALRAVTMAAALVGTLWGILKWKEFEGADGKIRTILLIALFIFVVGIVGLSASAGISTAG